MKRLAVLSILITLTVVAAQSPRQAQAQESPPADAIPDDVAALIIDQTLLVTAGTQDSMRITPAPGIGSGRSIRCGWFGVTVASTGAVDFPQIADPIIGRTYLLWCWYVPELKSLPGHPVPITYTGPGLPGEPADANEVSEFALASMEFVTPSTVLNPDAAQIVGIESWLAIDGRLDYTPIHASAGPVWVSVWPRFREVVWDLGNGDIVRCVGEAAATTVWDPVLHNQASDCTYTYERAGRDDGAHTISATVTWTILRRTFEHDSWVRWRDFSLTTSRTIEVTELQAVIN